MARIAARGVRPGGLHPELRPLEELARNLFWTWDADCRALFAGVDSSLWRRTEHNPIKMLRRLPAARQAKLAGDDDFLTRMRHCRRKLDAYLSAPTWFEETQSGRASGARRTMRGPGAPLKARRESATGGVPSASDRRLVAYFSMEYGLHESLPIYAGGLGILAGDHLKSCSDLGVPLVGVGIFWKEGYTRQSIAADGSQTDRFPALDPADTPLLEVADARGRPLRLELSLGHGNKGRSRSGRSQGDVVTLRGWRVQVGRVPLVLLDADLPENAPALRRLTHRLYIGDRQTRIRQELVLGIGGWRMLRAMRLPVAACHLNEGHAAFVSLERIAQTMKEGGSRFAAAKKRVAATTVFTTHTPVPAGNEAFDATLVESHVGHYAEHLKLKPAALIDLGRVRPGNAREPFGMTPLALRTSERANGVSALHGLVARRMWKNLWPGRKLDQAPIGWVTNGIHLRTWIHPQMAELLAMFLRPDWDQQQDEPKLWQAALRIPDVLLWRRHQDMKAELLAFVRERQAPQSARRSASPTPAEPGLLPHALTIGFARRFAAYKRAALIFTDPERLERIINDPLRPVQILFAGKAHPADAEGKAVLQRIARYAASPRFHGRIVLLEDYEMDVARRMVAGVDVWLNNPRRPQEASGTSGMKPALHGGLNFSVLDGWWPEAYDGENGWAIGRARDHDGTAQADRRDAEELYRILEQEIAPTYYDTDEYGLPRRWIARMKHAVATIPPVFNSHRQVKEYWRRYYQPALRAAARRQLATRRIQD